jgi:hypothetical protein
MITTEISQLVAPEVMSWTYCRAVRLYGQDVTAFVSLHEDELRRRAGCGLGPVRDSALLRELFELPEGIAMPCASISAWSRSVLSRAPDGVGEWSDSGFTRLACPPLRVDTVVVQARDWRVGIDRASAFGPFCRRVLVLAAPPVGEEQDHLELEAALYGVGVIAAYGRDEEWVVSPEPFRPRRLSSGHWLFQERVYAELLRAGGPGLSA